jgi:hypothetical protein
MLDLGCLDSVEGGGDLRGRDLEVGALGDVGTRELDVGGRDISLGGAGDLRGRAAAGDIGGRALDGGARDVRLDLVTGGYDLRAFCALASERWRRSDGGLRAASRREASQDSRWESRMPIRRADKRVTCGPRPSRIITRSDGSPIPSIAAVCLIVRTQSNCGVPPPLRSSRESPVDATDISLPPLMSFGSYYQLTLRS